MIRRFCDVCGTELTTSEGTSLHLSNTFTPSQPVDGRRRYLHVLVHRVVSFDNILKAPRDTENIEDLMTHTKLQENDVCTRCIFDVINKRRLGPRPIDPGSKA